MLVKIKTICSQQDKFRNDSETFWFRFQNDIRTFLLSFLTLLVGGSSGCWRAGWGNRLPLYMRPVGGTSGC
jgi:hypothetical protein